MSKRKNKPKLCLQFGLICDRCGNAEALHFDMFTLTEEEKKALHKKLIKMQAQQKHDTRRVL